MTDLPKKEWPRCVVIPGKNGDLEKCLQVKMPSMTQIVIILIISWLLFMLVAYIIYSFLNWANPGQKNNYWMILLILILAGIIVSILSYLVSGARPMY